MTGLCQELQTARIQQCGLGTDDEAVFLYWIGYRQRVSRRQDRRVRARLQSNEKMLSSSADTLSVPHHSKRNIQ